MHCIETKARGINEAHETAITKIVGAGLVFLTLASEDENAKIWDLKSASLCFALAHYHPVCCAASVCIEGDILVRNNNKEFTLICVFWLMKQKTVDILIPDDDTLLLAILEGTVSFVSISQKAILSKIRFDNWSIRCISIFDDGRIGVGGSDCEEKLFKPRANVSNSVSTYIENKQIDYYKKIKQQYPLRNAWIAIRDSRLTLHDCTKPIAEWCFAHNVLMETVRIGAVLASRNFEESELRCLQVLYKYIDQSWQWELVSLRL